MPLVPLIARIPWTQLVSSAIAVGNEVRRWRQQQSEQRDERPASVVGDGDDQSPERRLASLTAQVQQLRTREAQLAGFVDELAQQYAEQARLSSLLARRVRVLTWISAIALGLAFAALWSG